MVTTRTLQPDIHPTPPPLTDLSAVVPAATGTAPSHLVDSTARYQVPTAALVAAVVVTAAAAWVPLPEATALHLRTTERRLLRVVNNTTRTFTSVQVGMTLVGRCSMACGVPASSSSCSRTALAAATIAAVKTTCGEVTSSSR